MRLAVIFVYFFLILDFGSFSRCDALAENAPVSDDPLRHGHALLIGITDYHDKHWPFLGDIPIQLNILRDGLSRHFDTVEVASDLTFSNLRDTITEFLEKYENEPNSRLLVYYAGHGYTETFLQYNELRGYITGVDTPYVDGTPAAYKAARSKSLSMGAIKSLVEDSVAHSIFFIFDSCFAGSIFTTRGGGTELIPWSRQRIEEVIQEPARDFLTAGTYKETVPAHSPLPQLILNVLKGDGDKYNLGVVSTTEMRDYLLANIGEIGLTPQAGRLPNPAFASGEFLFRVIHPATPNSSPPVVEADDAIARYRVAAEHGDATAQVSLGYAYENGQSGLAKDEREAARLYKLAADQGNAAAQNNLGVYYREGRGGLAKNEREAARFFKLGADQGDAVAQTSLGYAYESGHGVPAKDEREAARLYKLAADQGDDVAQSNLGNFYRDGRGGLPKDEREAIRLFKLAANQGVAAAQTSLGYGYENGQGGLAKDEREAERLYKLAADQGDLVAQSNLGAFYRDGRGGLPKDEREAVRLFKLAADQGGAAAQASLGYAYENGEGGLAKDEREAARLYKLAADQGDAVGQNNLGVYYRDGRGGLVKDDREAARLFTLAANQGDDNARQSLQLLKTKKATK